MAFTFAGYALMKIHEIVPTLVAGSLSSRAEKENQKFGFIEYFL
jgi:hypothetical protein